MKNILLFFLLIQFSTAYAQDLEIFLSEDDTVLTGQFLFGDSIFVEGNCIRGNCQNDFGMFKADTTFIYEGNFLNGQANGQGTLRLHTGSFWKGTWKKGNFVEGLFFDVEDSITYEGKFVSKYDNYGKNFVADGKIKCHFQNNMIEKQFLNGQAIDQIPLTVANTRKPPVQFRETYPEPNFRNLKMIGRVGRLGVEANNFDEKIQGILLRSLRYQNITRAVERKYGLENNILLAMIMHETGGVAALPNRLNDGGIGLCHMQGIVAEKFGLNTVCTNNCMNNNKIVCRTHGLSLKKIIRQKNGNIKKLIQCDDRFNPLLNIDAAGRMLAHHKKNPLRNKTALQSAIFRYAGGHNYKKYWREVNFFLRVLDTDSRKESTKQNFERLNPHISFEEYIKAHQLQNYNYGLGSYMN